MKAIGDSVVKHLRKVIELPDLDGMKYRLIEKIASGGMGTVYLAEDTELHRTVALKVMNTSLVSSDIAQRTLQEAQFIAGLEHPGIIPIHDVGTLPDGRVFYVMKRVEGKRLDEIIKSGESQRDLLRLFQKICEPLAFAHARGIIHRDLKPENIMVGNYGEVLIMDWGAAKKINSQPEENGSSPGLKSIPATNDTASGTVIGTPGYMAPEQVQGLVAQQDARTDIYALGGILHYMLTGRPPEKDQTGSQREPRSISKNVSKQLNAICRKLRSPNPDDRYPAVQEISSDITRYLDGLPVSAYKENFFESFGRWFNRNQVLIWMIIAYLVMRAIVLIFFGR